MTIQTLLVEDNMALAKTITAYLELQEIACDFASNGEAGLNLALANGYQVILLDINLPRMNGFRVCEVLRERGVEVPVLMLTARDTLDDKLTGFDAGTDDYLVKPFQMEELVARVRALAHRRSSRTKRLVLADLEVDLSKQTARRGGRLLDLTPTGWILLVTLMRGAPNVVSRAELESAVWRDDPPDSDLLKVHMYRLRRKLDKPFERPLIHTIPNQGFVIREDHE